MKRRTFLTGTCTSVAAFFGLGRRLPSSGENVALAAKLDDSVPPGWENVEQVRQVLDEFEPLPHPKKLEKHCANRHCGTMICWWDKDFEPGLFCCYCQNSGKLMWLREGLDRPMNSEQAQQWIEDFAKRKLSS